MERLIQPNRACRALEPAASLRRSFLLRLLLFASVTAAVCALIAHNRVSAQEGAKGADTCYDCHARLDGRLLVRADDMKHDIHRVNGISCVACHGGDPSQTDKALSKSRAHGYTGVPLRRDIPALCGKCHSSAEYMKKFKPSLRVDQQTEYLTSVHGRLLQSGDRNVATCANCHGYHGVRAVGDPESRVYPTNVAETCARCHSDGTLMKSYQLATDQFVKYKASVHAKALYERQDLSAPTCNDCHGNHGATPPGISSVANICGQCHVRQSELFQASPHKAAYDRLSLSECAQCHGNHEIAAPSDGMIGTVQGSLCIDCHAKNDKGFAAADRMRGMLGELQAGIERSNEILDRAERAGMEVSRPKFEMSDARDALTNARVVIHAFSVPEMEKVTGPGLDAAKRGYQKGEEALSELRFRRKGLGVSLFFITFLAFLIYLKIRQIEAKQSASAA